MSARTERTPIEPELVGTSVGSRHAGYPPAYSKMAPKDIGAIEGMIRLIFGLGIGWQLAQLGENCDADEGSAGDTWLGVDCRC